MGKRYRLTGEVKEELGRTLHRVSWLEDDRPGGWIEDASSLPQDGKAVLYSDVLVFKEAHLLGGRFYGGSFRGGDFHDGNFRGGDFDGGFFRGGVFYDGSYRGGVFRGGEFYGGEYHGGRFYSGRFYGGVFNRSPATAQRSDGYVFVGHRVDGQLRIWAGCRNFSFDEAMAHWHDDHRYGPEMQIILNYLKNIVEFREAV